MCSILKVQPPAEMTASEMNGARDRLRALTGDRQFALSQELCRMALGDLAWLSVYGRDGQQKVLGPGSVVVRSGFIREPTTIIRPEVWHNFNQTTQTVERELAYTGDDRRAFRATDIIQELTTTTWPLTQEFVVFSWEGPENPHYFNGQDLRMQAKKLDIPFDDNTSSDRLRPQVVGGTALECERQYKAAVDAVWQRRIKEIDQAAQNAAQNAAQEAAIAYQNAMPPEEAKPSEDAKPPEDAKPAEDAKPPEEEAASTSTGSVSTANQAIPNSSSNTGVEKPKKELRKRTNAGDAAGSNKTKMRKRRNGVRHAVP